MPQIFRFFDVLFFCRPTSRSTVSSSKQPASNFEEIVKRPDSNPRPEVDDTAVSKPTATRSLWEVAWEAHKYFSGTLFVLLAIYCSVNILHLHTHYQVIFIEIHYNLVNKLFV